MSDYTTGDRVTAYGEVGTVLRRIPGTGIYAVDFDNGDHDTATAAAMAPADPRVSHVGRPTSELTPAELRARRELTRRVHTRRAMITSTATRPTAWFVR